NSRSQDGNLRGLDFDGSIMRKSLCQAKMLLE
ncbi:unnamed protein product, partial [marine sediment metagenome]